MNVFISPLRAGRLTMATICVYVPNGDILPMGVPHLNAVEATKAARAYGLTVVTAAKARSLATKPKAAASANGPKVKRK